MCWRAIFLIAATGLVIGCSKSEQGASSPVTDAQSRIGDLVVGKPLQHGNLTIFPVSSKTPRNDDRFVTLDEGLKAGTVEIREVGTGEGAVPQVINVPGEAAPNPFSEIPPAQESPERQAQTANQPPADTRPNANPNQQVQTSSRSSPDVNRLIVLNRSNRPLYLMPGEIIIGGQQDRVIGEERIVEANGKPTEIEVFCVEHGRWRNRDAAELRLYVVSSETEPELQALQTVQANGAENAEIAAKEAASGKFIGSAGNLNKAARLAVQAARNQSDVWDKVAGENAKSGADKANSSGAFTKNYSDT